MTSRNLVLVMHSRLDEHTVAAVCKCNIATADATFVVEQAAEKAHSMQPLPNHFGFLFFVSVWLCACKGVPLFDQCWHHSLGKSEIYFRQIIRLTVAHFRDVGVVFPSLSLPAPHSAVKSHSSPLVRNLSDLIPRTVAGSAPDLSHAATKRRFNPAGTG